MKATELTKLNTTQLIKKIGPLCTSDQKKSGVLASVTLAQFILESSWGKSELIQKANNAFGMKCSLSGNTWPDSAWDGKSKYTKKTKEEKDGKTIIVSADFRKYSTLEKSILDHSAYLVGAKKGSKLRFSGLKGCTDYKKAFTIIKNGGYATDSEYVSKLCKIVEQYKLTQYNYKGDEKNMADKKKYNVHGGHNKKVPGICSYLNEVTEDRKIKNKVIEYLKSEGHTAYDCTDDNGKTQSANLSNIVKKCNAHTVDFDVSIHLNGNKKDPGDKKIKGVEVWVYNKSSKAKDAANRVCKKLAALGFTNRGVKYSTSLYVLKHTDSPSMLIEVCFADDKDDVNLYNKLGVDEISKAIAEGILNKTIGSSTTTNISSKTIKAGSSVKIKSGAKYGGAAAGKKVGSAYIGKKYTVTKVQKNNGQQEALIKQLNSWVPTKYLTVV